MINLCCNKLKVQNVYEVHRLEHGYGDLSIGTELVGRIIDNNAYDCKILFNCYHPISHRQVTKFLSPNALSTRATFIQNLFCFTNSRG